MKWRRIRRSLPDGRRTPYMTEVPLEVREEAQSLFNEIADQVDVEFAQIKPEDQIDIQLEMKPTHLIASEEWSVSTGLGLGVEREALGYTSARYVTRNKHSLRGWAQTVSRTGLEDIHVF